MAIGISRYHDASGIVGMTVRFHTRERYERTSQPATDVYAAAPNAHSWPSRETPPSVPGGTGSPVVMRTVFRESTPISLARVSAPATDRAERKMTPLMIFGKLAGIVREIAATAMGANPFASTFVDFRSPRTPSWTPNASFKANRYRVARKLESRKNSRRNSHVTSPKIPMTMPTTNAARLPSHVSTSRRYARALKAPVRTVLTRTEGTKSSGIGRGNRGPVIAFPTQFSDRAYQESRERWFCSARPLSHFSSAALIRSGEKSCSSQSM